MSSYLRCLPWNNSRKNTFCWKHCCANFSIVFWVVFLALLAGKFGRFIRTVCLPVRCNLCRLYFKNSWFSKTIGTEQKHLKIFGSKYSPVLSKNQIPCSKEERREEALLRKLTGLFWFWAHKFFSSLAKIDEQRCQNCIRFVQKTELREKSFVKKILAIVFFRILS